MRPLLAGLVSLALAMPAVGADSGGLVGVGVKRCEGLTAAAGGADRGEVEGVLELRRYSDWVAGFVTGLNLATGEDLLRQLSLDGAMRRIALHCADHPDEEVFTAVRTVLRALQSPEREDEPPGKRQPATRR
jgi:hypothetical protein